MSLKSIEMQVALPRTQDFGRMQEQQNQRAMINQHLDSEEQRLKQMRDRQKSEQVDSTENNRVQSEEENSPSHDQQKHKKGKSKKKQEQISSHPFKGKHIDLSL